MAGPKVVSSSTSGRGDEGGTCGCGNGGSGGGGAGGCLEPASRRRPSGAARAVRNIRALAWEPLGLDLPDGGGGGGGGLLFPALLAHALDLTGPVIANNSISKTGPKAGVGINGAPAFEAEIALGVMAALPAPALLRASLGGPLPPANCPRTASAHGTGAADGATGAPPGRPVPAGAPLMPPAGAALGLRRRAGSWQRHPEGPRRTPEEHQKNTRRTQKEKNTTCCRITMEPKGQLSLRRSQSR